MEYFYFNWILFKNFIDFLKLLKAKICKIFRIRVVSLCKEGRIEGAICKCKTWLIPAGTEKPKDPRHSSTEDNE